MSFCERRDREAACDELVRALREAGFADVELEVESQAGEPPVRRAARP